jgi:hypothetical protein
VKQSGFALGALILGAICRRAHTRGWDGRERRKSTRRRTDQPDLHEPPHPDDVP